MVYISKYPIHFSVDVNKIKCYFRCSLILVCVKLTKLNRNLLNLARKMASIAAPPTNTKEQMTIRAISAAEILDECWGKTSCVVKCTETNI